MHQGTTLLYTLLHSEKLAHMSPYTLFTPCTLHSSPRRNLIGLVINSTVKHNVCKVKCAKRKQNFEIRKNYRDLNVCILKCAIKKQFWRLFEGFWKHFIFFYTWIIQQKSQINSNFKISSLSCRKHCFYVLFKFSGVWDFKMPMYRLLVLFEVVNEVNLAHFHIARQACLNSELRWRTLCMCS